jgi:hypothetical protein
MAIQLYNDNKMIEFLTQSPRLVVVVVGGYLMDLQWCEGYPGEQECCHECLLMEMWWPHPIQWEISVPVIGDFPLTRPACSLSCVVRAWIRYYT